MQHTASWRRRPPDGASLLPVRLGDLVRRGGHGEPAGLAHLPGQIRRQAVVVDRYGERGVTGAAVALFQLNLVCCLPRPEMGVCDRKELLVIPLEKYPNKTVFFILLIALFFQRWVGIFAFYNNTTMGAAEELRRLSTRDVSRGAPYHAQQGVK